jgi:mono/diheme cytochrome c family protein
MSDLSATISHRGHMSVKLIVAAIGMAALGVFGAMGSRSALSAQEAPKTQWDGVYTLEQAQRGEPLYAEKCSSCHGPDLNGGEMAPGLIGGEFSANWNELSLGDLFERMRISMPQNNPGSLSRQQNADVLAFILHRANYPAGTTELPTQTEMLNMYKFIALKPGA